jgi:hypothetical protein
MGSTTRPSGTVSRLRTLSAAGEQGPPYVALNCVSAAFLTTVAWIFSCQDFVVGVDHLGRRLCITELLAPDAHAAMYPISLMSG